MVAASCKWPPVSRETFSRGTGTTLPSRSPNPYIPALIFSTVPVGRVIAVANQKGGVGKTTTAVNLAASLAAAEQRTLLIDGDPQGNATSGVGLQKETIPLTLYDVLSGNSDLRSARQTSVQFEKLDVIGATPDLAAAEVELVDRDDRDHVMRLALETLREDYDFVIIDCPPSLGLITINMLAAAED